MDDVAITEPVVDMDVVNEGDSPKKRSREEEPVEAATVALEEPVAEEEMREVTEAPTSTAKDSDSDDEPVQRKKLKRMKKMADSDEDSEDEAPDAEAAAEPDIADDETAPAQPEGEEEDDEVNQNIAHLSQPTHFLAPKKILCEG